MDEITEDEVVRAAQAAQRNRRALSGLLSDVADSVVAEDQAGGAIAHLPESLYSAIRRSVTE